MLICESTFGAELEDKAEEYRHLTVKQTAEIAKKSKSKKLVLNTYKPEIQQKSKEYSAGSKEDFQEFCLG